MQNYAQIGDIDHYSLRTYFHPWSKMGHQNISFVS